ncbi:MAG TPA: nucleotidyl transferase AbiEii/AbiGii toxin family protein [Thermoanaerobaculia bacterium]|jgi:hypothetical protein
MKEYLRAQVSAVPDRLRGRHVVREVLQAKILASLQRAGAMIPLAFHGGTALRFLYAIRRFSEDLDFALERPRADYVFKAYLRTIRSDLARESYVVDVKMNDRKVVHSAFIRFPGLLFELDLSPHRTEVLAIKLEIDTNPPAGAGLATTVIRRHATLQLQHHDRASLLSGKLHAVLQRTYTKGRDLYDLIWYLSDPDWPPPNLEMLNNALRQSGWSGPELEASNWRRHVGDRLRELDWSRAVADLRPFVESEADLDLVTMGNARRLLDT